MQKTLPQLEEVCAAMTTIGETKVVPLNEKPGSGQLALLGLRVSRQRMHTHIYVTRAGTELEPAAQVECRENRL
jgi:hypothetical protein